MAMKQFYLILSFVVLCFGASAQRTAAPDFSKIKDYQKQMDSLIKYCSLMLGSDSSLAENFPQALVYADLGLKFVKKDDYKSRCHFSLVKGIAYYNLAQFDSALHYVETASTLSFNTKNAALIAGSHSSMIPILMQTQQADKAESAVKILKSISDTTKDLLALDKSYYGLGNFYYFKSYYATAQSYFIKSLEINSKLSDTSVDNRLRLEYAVQHYMLYKIFTNTELYDKALAALKSGSKYIHLSPKLMQRYQSAYVEVYTFLPSTNIDSALFYYHQLGESPRSKGISSEYVMSNIALAQYFTKRKDFEQANTYLERATQLADESKAPFLIHQVDNMKGIYFFNKGNYDEAITYFNKALPISKNINLSNYLESTHLIAEAYKAKGNLLKAVEYYDIYDKEKDAYVKANMTRNFADLETQYRTKEKEKEIKLLHDSNKLRELELENERKLRLLMIGGLIALGAISTLLYRIYRNKEKLNQALNERNAELDTLNAKLAIANESKAKLFGIFSHDLRSPVSKIAQFLRLQKENPNLFNDNAQSDYHAKFTSTTANLLNTMEDLLLWSKSQMESFHPDYHSVSIKSLTDKEINLLGSLIEDKNLEVDNKIPESFLSLTDENFVSIIVRNLLQNAVRYSENDSTIVLEAKTNQLIISNTAKGGLKATELNALLKKGEVNSHNFGLGLQIAKDLAERIGITLSFYQKEEDCVSGVLEWD